MGVRPWCNRIAYAAGFALALGWAVPASAQNASDQMARKHFESGVAYLEESDYDNALKAFQKAYDLSKRPAILLNIATVQERKGDIKSAVETLKAYVQAEPNGEHAETAKLRIQNLEKRLEEQQTAEPAAAEPAPAEPAPQAAPPPPSSPPPPAPVPAAEPEPPNRVPAYVVLGIGGALAGGALVTGLVANGKHADLKDSCSPNCTDDEVSSAKTMAWVSTGLTIGAVVGVGVGVVLLVTSSGSSESAPAAASLAPKLDVSLDTRQADARATWRF